MADSILAVLLNWRRPDNIPRVITALRNQSVRMTIALVECSPDTPFAVPPAVRNSADVCFSVNHNLGPASRFIPPLAMHGFEWTFFAVDDHLPGPRHVEWLLQCARGFSDPLRFATIGQDGRIVRDGAILRRKIKMRPNAVTPVDFITSSELALTRRVREALTIYDILRQDWGGEATDFEDDLILCIGAQIRLRQVVGDEEPCYLTPEPPSKEESWRAARLPSPHALCARADHHERRDRFVRLAIEAGWHPPADRVATNQ